MFGFGVWFWYVLVWFMEFLTRSKQQQNNSVPKNFFGKAKHGQTKEHNLKDNPRTIINTFKNDLLHVHPTLKYLHMILLLISLSLCYLVVFEDFVSSQKGYSTVNLQLLQYYLFSHQKTKVFHWPFISCGCVSFEDGWSPHDEEAARNDPLRFHLPLLHLSQ